MFRDGCLSAEIAVCTAFSSSIHVRRPFAHDPKDRTRARPTPSNRVRHVLLGTQYPGGRGRANNCAWLTFGTHRYMQPMYKLTISFLGVASAL